jgi:hypothetical protein
VNDDQLLDLCLSVTGVFESAKPAYDALAGNFDGQGMSVGVAQWNAGQGTLQKLVAAIAAKIGWPAVQSHFVSDIQSFSAMPPAAALAFVSQHYLLPGSTRLSPAAIAAWKGLLGTQASIDAQRELLSTTTLAHAHRLAALYTPEFADRNRVIAFFFDLVNQQGSMVSVHVSPSTSPDAALAFTATQSAVCHAEWVPIVAADPVAAKLLYYGYQRSLLARAAYVWDTFSRHGAIACRVGIVHGSKVDLTTTLD